MDGFRAASIAKWCDESPTVKREAIDAQHEIADPIVSESRSKQTSDPGTHPCTSANKTIQDRPSAVPHSPPKVQSQMKPSAKFRKQGHPIADTTVPKRNKASNGATNNRIRQYVLVTTLAIASEHPLSIVEISGVATSEGINTTLSCFEDSTPLNISYLELLDQNDEQQRYIRGLELKIAGLEDDMAFLEGKLEKATISGSGPPRDVDNLKRLLESVNAVCAGQPRSLKECRQERDQSRTAESEIRRVVECLVNQRRAIDKNAETGWRVVTVLREGITQLEEKQGDLQQSLVDTKEQLAVRDQQYWECRKVADEAIRRAKLLKEETRLAQAEAAKARKEVSVVSSRTPLIASAGLTQRMMKLQAENIRLEERRIDVEQRMGLTEREKRAHKDLIGRLNAEIREMKSAIQSNEAQISYLRPSHDAYLHIVNGNFETFLRVENPDGEAFNKTIVERRNELCHHATFNDYCRLLHPQFGTPRRANDTDQRFKRIFGCSAKDGIAIKEKVSKYDATNTNHVRDLLDWHGTIAVNQDMCREDKEEFCTDVTKAIKRYVDDSESGGLFQGSKRAGDELKAEHSHLEQRYFSLRLKARNAWRVSEGKRPMDTEELGRFRKVLIHQRRDSNQRD